jgi:hypothetical protein
MAHRSSWQEPIDLRVGRLPIVRATGAAVTYELIVQGGIMRDRLWLPPPRTCLAIRIDDEGGIFAREIRARGRR